MEASICIFWNSHNSVGSNALKAPEKSMNIFLSLITEANGLWHLQPQLKDNEETVLKGVQFLTKVN